MNEPIHLVFPARLIPAANKVYYSDHWLRARKVKEALDAICAFIYHQLEHKPEPFTVPVSITIYAGYAGNPRDVDAVTKLLHDGLVAAGILSDDGYKQVPEAHQYVKKVKKSIERVEVWVEPIAESNSPA